MNETDLILRQITIERLHASELIAACRALDPSAPRASEFIQACLGYLALIEQRWRTRVRGHAERLQAMGDRLGGRGEPRQAALTRALAELRRLDEPPLTTGRTRQDTNSEIKSYTDFLMSYVTSIGDLDTLVAPLYTVADWRAVAALDADAVLEERRRYAALSAEPFLQAQASA